MHAAKPKGEAMEYEEDNTPADVARRIMTKKLTTKVRNGEVSIEELVDNYMRVYELKLAYRRHTINACRNIVRP